MDLIWLKAIGFTLLVSSPVWGILIWCKVKGFGGFGHLSDEDNIED